LKPNQLISLATQTPTSCTLQGQCFAANPNKSELLFIFLALSVWTSYSQISNCQKITNDMQDTAIEMAEKADEIEKIKRRDVDPLLQNVKTKVTIHRYTI
jgi:hypothetical protein